MCRSRKKNISSTKRLWKTITSRSRACADAIFRRPKIPPKQHCLAPKHGTPCLRGSHACLNQENTRVMVEKQNPSLQQSIMEQEETINEPVLPKTEASDTEAALASMSLHGTTTTTTITDDTIFDDFIRRNRERFQLEKENSLEGLNDINAAYVDDSTFEEFIERNRERFRLEKENSLESLNYYAMWPCNAYFDPNF